MLFGNFKKSRASFDEWKTLQKLRNKLYIETKNGSQLIGWWKSFESKVKFELCILRGKFISVFCDRTKLLAISQFSRMRYYFLFVGKSRNYFLKVFKNYFFAEQTFCGQSKIIFVEQQQLFYGNSFLAKYTLFLGIKIWKIGTRTCGSNGFFLIRNGTTKVIKNIDFFFVVKGEKSKQRNEKNNTPRVWENGF